jgi:hypothetical protein
MLRRAQLTLQTGRKIAQPNDILPSLGVAADRRRSRDLTANRIPASSRKAIALAWPNSPANSSLRSRNRLP